MTALRHGWLALLWVAVCSFAAELPVSDEEKAAGKKLAAELRAVTPGENSEITGVLKIRGRNFRNDVPVTCKIVAGDKSWQSIYEAKATPLSAAETLIIVRSSNAPNQYLYARAPQPKDPLPTPAPLPIEKAGVPFAGSDFRCTDLGLEFLHWPEQERVKGEMRLGRPCHVLESRDPKGTEVVRVKSWIDKETGGLLIAEAYDRDNRTVKEFSLSGSSFRKIDGRWQLEEMRIRSPRVGSQTILKFNLETEPPDRERSAPPPARVP
jgi:hypothetical protein